MRKRIFQIIEASDVNDCLSSIYDYTMIFVIVASLAPLAFKADNLLAHFCAIRFRSMQSSIWFPFCRRLPC